MERDHDDRDGYGMHHLFSHTTNLLAEDILFQMNRPSFTLAALSVLVATANAFAWSSRSRSSRRHTSTASSPSNVVAVTNIRRLPSAIRMTEDNLDSLESSDPSPASASDSVEDTVVPTATTTSLDQQVEEEVEVEPMQPTEPESSTTTVNNDNIKDSLLWLQSLGAITGRGEFASKPQKKAAVQVLRTLEQSNPTPEPARSPSSLGRWELVYAETHAFRASPFFLAGRAVCTTPSQAQQFAWFCDMHRAALAVSQVAAVRQIVSNDRLVSEFEVQAGAVPFLSDFTPFAYSGGIPVTITGAIVSSAEAAATADGSGWELLMDTVEIKGSNLPGVRQILDRGLKLQSRPLGNWLEQNVDQYTNPRPVLSITYLDDTFRISRDQDGNAYCYIKTSPSTDFTDYNSVDADLGVLKLLEGFNDAVTKFYL